MESEVHMKINIYLLTRVKATPLSMEGSGDVVCSSCAQSQCVVFSFDRRFAQTSRKATTGTTLFLLQ